jgi:hypothetical protein
LQWIGQDEISKAFGVAHGILVTAVFGGNLHGEFMRVPVEGFVLLAYGLSALGEAELWGLSGND